MISGQERLAEPAGHDDGGSGVALFDYDGDDDLDVYLVQGLFDVVGRIFIASLKLLVVPLVLDHAVRAYRWAPAGDRRSAGALDRPWTAPALAP